MAQTLRSDLLEKEARWRVTNPEWQQKMAQYEEWLSRTKDRERAATRATKKKADLDDFKLETVVEWQATFDPKAPLPQFSLAGQNTSFTQSMLKEELNELARWTSTPKWALFCLGRGIAVHHAGMNKRYRTLIETYANFIYSFCVSRSFTRLDSLFRRGFLRVIFATGHSFCEAFN